MFKCPDWRTMPPSDVELIEYLPKISPESEEQSIIPGTYEHVTIHGKEEM